MRAVIISEVMTTTIVYHFKVVLDFKAFQPLRLPTASTSAKLMPHKNINAIITQLLYISANCA